MMLWGQQHLLGKNGLLRRVIESGSIPNLIFYGPSGVGKTTGVASIIAKQTDRKLYHLNATTAGIADIKAIIDELDTFLTPNGALVYLDEIQYLNKKQQQSLLECIEDRQRSRSSPPPPRTRISIFTTRCSTPLQRCLSSSRPDASEDAAPRSTGERSA